MNLGLTNKIALVCAASQGLGFAVADELAAEGASLVICSRSEANIGKAAAAINETRGVDVLAVTGDLSVSVDIERIVAAGIERFGRIDILVTNGGGPPAGNFDSLDAAAWEIATRSVLTSVIDLTRLVLPGMKERRWGRIVNITSIASKQPVENLMLSNSLRAAVTGFAKTLAGEVAADGVTVNNILPGYTRTERLEELIDFLANKESLTADEIKARWESEIPIQRLGETREFAALAAFLVSERASYITGTSITVDGGWTKALF